MFPAPLQRLRTSLKGGVALAVEFATLGEVILEEDQDRSSAGRLIGEHRRVLAKQPARPAAHEDILRRGTEAAVEPECGERRVRAPSREPRRRRPAPEPAFQFCLD